MRLAQFIETRMEAILQDWETFAKSISPASSGMDAAALRDHAEQILRTVVLDLGTAQTDAEQMAKSRGTTSVELHPKKTSAEIHGALRAASGFSLKQLVAEYRALRASVLRLWAQAYEPSRDSLYDMTRFNEAIDQAVAGSIDFFTLETERWRNVFLGVLGHDLRGPLNAMMLTSQVLIRADENTPVPMLAARLVNGGERMKQLLDDLLDYSRTSLAMGIPVSPTDVDLNQVCNAEVELQRAALPGIAINLVSEGSTEGRWDAARLRQLLGNLISNAAKYGDAGAPVTVRLVGSDEDIRLSVENLGPTITLDGMNTLFEPFQRGAHSEGEAERTSLGLGLFVVREIARAHGGSVAVTSVARQTCFCVTLPRAGLRGTVPLAPFEGHLASAPGARGALS